MPLPVKSKLSPTGNSLIDANGVESTIKGTRFAIIYPYAGTSIVPLLATTAKLPE